jgi:hypothetical protein
VVNNASQASDRSNLIVPIVIAVALIPIVGAAWWWLERDTGPATPPALTDEAKAYTRNLKLGGVNMQAKTNFTGAPLVEITGEITNTGDRPLSLVELNCVFYDPYGQVVLRERVPIVRSALAPGGTRQFRLPFEGLPDSWNRAMPQLVIANIRFGS